jgi:GT2 family glycosyltransferase
MNFTAGADIGGGVRSVTDEAYSTGAALPMTRFGEATRRLPLHNHRVLLMHLQNRIGYEEAAMAFRRVLGAQPGLHHLLETDEDGEVCFRPLPEAEWLLLDEILISALGSKVERGPIALTALQSLVDIGEKSEPDVIRAAWLGTSNGGSFMLFRLPRAVANSYALVLLPTLVDTAVVWTAFPLLVERFTGGSAAIWATLAWPRRNSADFATLPNAAIVACFIPGTKDDNFISAVRAAMRQHAAITAGAMGELSETGRPVVSDFELKNDNQLLPENHLRLTIGDAVLWSPDHSQAAPAEEPRIMMRPPVGEAPGGLKLCGDLSVFGLNRPEILLSSYIRLLEATVASPWLPPAALPRLHAGVTLRLLRPASGAATLPEAILVLPLLRSGASYSGVFTTDALKKFDIWGFAVDQDDSQLLKDGAWLDYAKAIVHQLLVPGGLTPRAIIGFSIGGFLAWLVDRLLVAAGRKPTPVVSLDGGVPDHQVEGWRQQIASLLPRAGEISASRMLLLYRVAPGRFTIPTCCDLDWAKEAVVLEALPCGTVCHSDFLHSSLSASHGGMIASYMDGGGIGVEVGALRAEIDTAGGAMFRLLENEVPPTADDVRAFFAVLPEEPVDYDIRLSLLYLALTCGDKELALEIAQRLAVEEPDLRDAFYAQVAWLAELGLSDEAVLVAETWCHNRPADPVMQWRATHRAEPPAAWNAGERLFIGNPDAALDLAAAFGVARLSGPAPAETKSDNFEGQIDFYGYNSTAGGWFVGGWVTHPRPWGHRPENAVAVFENATLNEHACSLFYNRADVSGCGIGFVFFFRSPPAQTGILKSARISFGWISQTIQPTDNVLFLSNQQLVDHLQGPIAEAEDLSQRQDIQGLLSPEPEPQDAEGLIDFYGYHSIAGGWLFCGWISHGWLEGLPPEWIVVSFEGGYVAGEAFAVLYPRPGLPGDAEGIAFFVRGDLRPLGKFCSVSFDAGGLRTTLEPVPVASRLQDAELVAQLRPIIGQANLGLHRDVMLGLLARQPYRGEDTLGDLDIPVFLEIDEAFFSGPGGIVLMGWFLARPNDVRAMRLRCGSLVTSLDLREDCIRIERQDVIEAFPQHGFTDTRCGFIAFLPKAVSRTSRIYIEIETAKREVGYRGVPAPKLDGLAAIKRLLSGVDVRFGEVQPAFDRVLGPAVEGLNHARLAKLPNVDTLRYGMIPDNPRYSVIVPLYGRLDFVEYQLALFSAHPGCGDIEFIYVLDDPPKRREAQFLFASVFERFQIPFKAILLDRNVGFAPANNIGLSQARGQFVSYLNSDVFPGTLDWLERLTGRLTADPTIGVIGPVLEFEDGSVQHRGMFFTRLPEFGNWFFGMHHDKGMRVVNNGQLEAHLSITGACMVMTRALAEEIGGLDETYVVGDFEDSDLCLKLQARGYRCVIDPEVRLFHLERKSQASSGLGWRMNLTVYNAWQHERRWGQIIAALQDR